MILSCEKTVFGGLGLCRTENGIVFAQGLMPKEIAECSSAGKSGGIPLFTVKNLIERSPHRREPFCKYFGLCGGCDWQFMDYQFQISRKIEIFLDVMKRTGKISAISKPKIFFDNEKSYRIRVKFSVDKKTGKTGFLSKKSHDIVEIEECQLLSENLNVFLKNLTGTNRKNITAIDAETAVISSLDNNTGEICVGEYKFEVNGYSFFQANRFLTPKMALWCAEQLDFCETLFDIYGGVCLFSVFCIKKVKKIILAEVDEGMAKAAQKTFDKNGIKNAVASALPAEKFFTQNRIKPDCIIVDPPRVGISKEAANGIVSLSPRKIIYISCDISTQARDCNFFVNECGYKIQKTAIFDCYPNTFHIESGIVLGK